ncbi:MAG: CheR family methyltransferase [Desulfosarcina sp.]
MTAKMKKPAAANPSESSFAVVGIGASAGGLDALEVFFDHLPARSGLAVIVITHTDPKRTSLLPTIIERRTKITVKVIETGMRIRPDTIYLPPSHSDLTIENECFHLTRRSKADGPHMPVDLFLTHLSDAWGDRAAGVILSGTGTDGSYGIRAIKEKGGLTAAQRPESAKHTGMPQSAIQTGLVDYVLTPEEMPGRLIDYFERARVASPPSTDRPSPDADRLDRILAILAERTHHDFSLYKPNTLERRIGRRMAITHSRDESAYVGLLTEDHREVQALFQDLLIGVTRFFRDPEAFDFMREQLATLLPAGANGSSLRVWIPGCATGEEAYSMAMLLKAVMQDKGVSREMQIFATDIDLKAIEKARTGRYLPNIAADVGTHWIKRFFIKDGGGYRVNRPLRESVVFAEQNLLRDPPFSDLDLLVCRNLLIYLKTEAQDRLIPLFHHTLKKNGLLFLGNSETIGRFPELFQPLSKSFSVFKKRELAVPPRIKFPTGKIESLPSTSSQQKPGPEAEPISLEKAVDDMLARAFPTTCVAVNDEGQVVYTRGRTGRYLELSPGRPNLNVADMAREGLRFPMLSALRKIRTAEGPIRADGLQVKTDGGVEWIDLTVTRFGLETLKDLTLMVIEASTAANGKKDRSGRGLDPAEDDRECSSESLEQELLRLREEYRGAREELETSNEELRSVNEEMQSSNEELQSTNEELESSREELQSLNEELNTVNDELQNKINELSEAYRSVTGTLNSTRIAMIFLDNDLCVTRFTQAATGLVNLIDSDLGRPFDHISNRLEFDNLVDRAAEVLQTLTAFEDEVKARDGHWYRINIMVHRCSEPFIEGVVITFVNIDAQKKAQLETAEMGRRALASARRFADSIIDTVREALLVLDEDLRVLTANQQFYKIFAVDPDRIEGHRLYEMQDGQWNISGLRDLLENVLQKDRYFEDYLVEQRLAGIGTKRLRLNGRHLVEEDKRQNKILLAIEEERVS